MDLAGAVDRPTPGHMMLMTRQIFQLFPIIERISSLVAFDKRPWSQWVKASPAETIRHRCLSDFSPVLMEFLFSDKEKEHLTNL